MIYKLEDSQFYPFMLKKIWSVAYNKEAKFMWIYYTLYKGISLDFGYGACN